MLLSFIQLGLVLVLFVLLMVVTVSFLLKFIVKSAPKDIQEVISKRSDPPLWKTILGIILLIIIMAGFLGVALWAAIDAVNTGMTFWQIFLRSEIILVGYKLFDMFIFDILIISKFRLFEKLFPENQENHIQSPQEIAKRMRIIMNNYE